MGKKLLLQYLLSVFLGLHLLTSKYLLDDALLINNKGGADGALGLLAVHHLLTPSTHRLQQRLVNVSNQRERQLMLLLKLDVRGSRVLANTHHLIACTLQFCIVVSQTASLSRTPAGIILWVEVQH